MKTLWGEIMKIKDWAGKIKQEAEEEVRAKNLIEALYYLTSKENPYAIDGAAATCHKTTLKVHYHGELVFSYAGGKLQKYICGQDDWTIALIDEFDRRKSEQRENELKGQIQTAVNEAAKENFVICSN
jgi:hypothetical protein